jgi:epoxyqueuosine reductase
MKSNIGTQIIEKAKEKGAAMAGIAGVELLKKSPSHDILNMETGLEIKDFAGISWPKDANSALVITVSHPEDKPELDWWDAKSSPGNNILIRIIRELCVWIQEEFGIKTQEMPYAVERGGIYLKDTAVLAGLGCIGRNNLLTTPELGPRVRLRAMLLLEDLPSTGTISFDPCDGCEEFCRKECPQNAFAERILLSSDVGMATLPGRDGFFSRANCMFQMNEDAKDSEVDLDDNVHLVSDSEEDFNMDALFKNIKYCRKCELSCPIGR